MSLKSLIDSYKTETVILGSIQRLLMAQQEFQGARRSDVLHPSELCKDDVCERALYYRLIGWEVPKDENAFQLETIFAQGHEYHDKWQNWAWDIGKLRGRFRCLSCGRGDWEVPNASKLDGPSELWTPTAPEVCPRCGAPRRFLQYGEVPLELPKYRISGHADGDLDIDPTDGPPNEDDPLMEIKSIGTGTVRFEAPKLIARHTKKVLIDGEEKNWTDWDKLWRDIRRPFPVHVRQGTLYCLAKNRRQMVYLYESKFNGGSKEYTVTADPEVVEDILEMCLDVDYAVKRGKIPRCRHGGCEKCEAYEKLRAGAPDEAAEESASREDSDSGESEATRSDSRDEDSREASRRVSRTSRRRRLQRVERSSGDRRDASVHSLGGLLERAARSGRDHRGDCRSDSSAGTRPGHAQHRSEERRGTSSQGRRRVVRRRP